MPLTRPTTKLTRRLTILLLCPLLLHAPTTRAQTQTQSQPTDQPANQPTNRPLKRQTALQIEMRGVRAMLAGDHQRAQRAFEELIQRKPQSYVGHYNLASALSQQGKLNAATDALSQALVLGFTDKPQLLRDPDLKALRQTEFFTQLLAGWDDILDSRHAADLDRMNKIVHARKMEHRTLNTLRLEIVSAHDPISTDQAIAELQLISTWTGHEIFTNLKDSIGLGGGNDSPWVMVGLPDRAGFKRWAIETFGPSVSGNFSSVGGAYEHQQRRLVAQDLGATLRHEFVHVLHWRDMARLAQNHAPWFQEGLASVVEDYDLISGKLVPVPSWRTNMVKRLVKIRRLPTIEELTSMDLPTFTNRKPLARYAQARTILMWLIDQNKLDAFYTNYTQSYKQDPTGLLALHTTIGLEGKELNSAYQDWVQTLPQVPETGSDLAATLGVSIENGTGDGVVVKNLSVEARRRTGLKLGMVITAIESRPTRDIHELIRVLGSYHPGQTIAVHWRRGTIHGINNIKLLGR